MSVKIKQTNAMAKKVIDVNSFVPGFQLTVCLYGLQQEACGQNGPFGQKPLAAKKILRMYV